MTFEFVSYLIPLLVSAIVTACVAFFGWRRRQAIGARPFIILLLATTGWTLAYALEVTAVGVENKVFSAKIQYIFIVMVPISWLSFAILYSGRKEWLTIANLALLSIVPLFTVGMAWSNDFHGLLWEEFALETSGSFTALSITYGPVFWLHTAYSYSLFLAGLFIIFHTAISSPRLYRGQGFAVMLGGMAPFIGSVMFVSGLSPAPLLDTTPFAFAVAGLIGGIALFRYRIFDILPIAYRAATRSMTDGIIILDEQGQVVDINPVVEVISGVKANDVISKYAQNAFAHMPEILELCSGVEEVHTEICIESSEGQRWYDAQCSIIYRRDNLPRGRLIVLRDITERKQAEEVLRRNNEQLEAEVQARVNAHNALTEIGLLVSSSLDINEVYGEFAERVRKLIPFNTISITIADVENDEFVVAYNMGIGAPTRPIHQKIPLKGSSTGEIIKSRTGMTLNLSDQEHLARTHPGLLPLAQAGHHSYVGVPLISRGAVIGALHFATMEAEAYEEKDLELANQIAHLIGDAVANAQLFGELKKSEAQLSRKTSDLQAIFDAFPDLFIWLTNDGIVTDYTATSDTGLLISEDGLLGRHIKDVMPPEVSEKVLDAIGESISQHSVTTVECSLLTSASVRGHFEVRVSPVQDEQVIAIIREITDRKTLEDQLVQAQKLQAIGQLAGGIAHDFNNMLASVMGYAQLAMMKMPEDDTISSYLQKVLSASEQAANLTQQLLVFSRRNVVETKLVNLNDLIFDMTEMLRHTISEDIELVILPADNLWLIRTDEGQIGNLLINLVVNARDAMPNGGRIVINTRNMLIHDYANLNPEVESGEYIVLEVSDTGIGMDEHTKSHIFDPFFTTKPVGKGTGLGLATGYGIVAQHGGHITVESSPGNGSTFKVYLPRVDEPVPYLDDPEEIIPLATGSEVILLVEDEGLVREMTADILRQQGYKVLEATNGVEGLRVAKSHSDGAIQLLLTDVMMPVMGGRELAEEFKVLHPEAKVIFVSGYTGNELNLQNLSIDNITFIRKPFTLAGLVNKVREVLGTSVSV